MRVCTYFEAIPELDTPAQREALGIWQDSWQRHGWTPVLLNEQDAKKHRLYDEFVEAIGRLPTANHPAYERACYLRWLAMAQIGGGWMVDYDVVNCGFRPREVEDGIGVWQNHNPCPCVVSGHALDYEYAVREMIAASRMEREDEIINGRPHTSDQNLCQRGLVTIRPETVVVPYPHNGELVHCSAHACAVAGKSKTEAMRSCSR